MDQEEEQKNLSRDDGPVVKIGQDEGIGKNAENNGGDGEWEISCR